MEIGAVKGTSVVEAANRQSRINRQVAEEFEAVFLSEMLKHTGLNKASPSFGGGFGEEAFASMLNEAFAQALAQSGDFGIADAVYESLSRQTDKG